ncbi:MAG: hypothetical protein Q9224_007364, partial [Gallowayella concinna]
MDGYSTEATTAQTFRLFDLPNDIRDVLFSHLLPSVPAIDCDTQHSLWPEYSFSRHDDDDNDCNDGYVPQILRVNHKLYNEGIDYLYLRKTFVINVYHTGFDFLKSSTQLRTLPNLPYHKMKEVIIRIPPHTLPTEGSDLRYNLLWLCGLLHSNDIHFKKMRIDFTDQYSGTWEPQNLAPETRHWNDEPDDTNTNPLPKMLPLWEYTDDEPINIPPQY